MSLSVKQHLTISTQGLSKPSTVTLLVVYSAICVSDVGTKKYCQVVLVYLNACRRSRWRLKTYSQP